MYIGFWSKWGNYLAKIADLQAHSIQCCDALGTYSLCGSGSGVVLLSWDTEGS